MVVHGLFSRIDNPVDENTFENFGISVNLSSDGTILAIGHRGMYSDNAFVGAVHVYQYNGSSWTFKKSY